MVVVCQGTGKLVKVMVPSLSHWVDCREISRSAAGWFGSMKVDAQAWEMPVVRMCLSGSSRLPCQQRVQECSP